MFRRFSAADLEDLRPRDLPWEGAAHESAAHERAAQSLRDCNCSDEPKDLTSVVARGTPATPQECSPGSTHRKATAAESLPMLQRTRVFVESDGNLVFKKRNPELDIATEAVPIYMNESVGDISGVRLPLPPQRAVTVDRLEESDARPRQARKLPVWKPAPSPSRSALNNDEAWVMRTNAMRNANIVQQGSGGAMLPVRSVRDAISAYLRKPQPTTWIGRMSQSQQLNNSELSLSVMAWEEGNEALPAVNSEHLKVVSVKGDVSPIVRRRPVGSKYVRIVAQPQSIETTWAPWEYDRRPALHCGFTLEQLIDMRNEMIVYKAKEMEVHPASRGNTHIYRKENFGLK